MKKCSGCRTEKEESKFSKNRRNPDGLHCDCKQCDSDRKKRFKIENPEKYKERRQKEYLRNKEKIDKKNNENYWKNRNERLLKNREYSRKEENKEKARTRNREFKRKKRALIAAKLLIEEDRKIRQKKAHEQVCVAVKTGKLNKPESCQKCGEKKDLQGHHEDYNKPLEVIWLCFICHCQRHNKLMDLL